MRKGCGQPLEIAAGKPAFHNPAWARCCTCFKKKPPNVSFHRAAEVELMTLYPVTLPMLTSIIRNAPGPGFSSL